MCLTHLIFGRSTAELKWKGKLRKGTEGKVLDCLLIRRKRSGEEEREEEIGPKMPKTDFTFDDLKEYMNGEFRDGIGKDMDRRLDVINGRLDKTQQELKSHKAHVEREMQSMRAELACNKPPVPETKALPTPGRMVQSGTARTERETRQYWRSRRSSRFFPIQGETEMELRNNLKIFLQEKLEMPTGDVGDDEIEQE